MRFGSERQEHRDTLQVALDIESIAGRACPTLFLVRDARERPPRRAGLILLGSFVHAAANGFDHRLRHDVSLTLAHVDPVAPSTTLAIAHTTTA